MKINKDTAIEKKIKSKLRYNQILLLVSLLLSAFSIIFFEELLLYLPFAFLLIGALSLPNINKCKEDMDRIKKNDLLNVAGTVVDFFPEKESGKNTRWILFVLDDKLNAYEFFFDEKLEINKDDVVEIIVTPKMKIPIELTKK